MQPDAGARRNRWGTQGGVRGGECACPEAGPFLVILEAGLTASLSGVDIQVHLKLCRATNLKRSREQAHAGLPGVQREGCGVVTALGVDDATRAKLETEGGIEAVLRAMRGHSGDEGVQVCIP